MGNYKSGNETYMFMLTHVNFMLSEKPLFEFSISHFSLEIIAWHNSNLMPFIVTRDDYVVFNRRMVRNQYQWLAMRGNIISAFYQLKTPKP